MSKLSLLAAIEKRWYSRPGILLALSPLELVFSLFINLRKKHQSKRAKKFTVPVIVVGNISVGGTGKTPTIIALVRFFQAQGLRPGVVSRGYGRASDNLALAKYSDSPEELGDEPAVIYRATRCDVAVSANRCEAVQSLIEQFNCDIILSDDGLQHYTLNRDLEIAVIDGDRRFGNGHLFPVGPLREPPDRLRYCDWVLVNGAGTDTNILSLPEAKVHTISIRATGVTHITTGDAFDLEKLDEMKKLVALAGLGNPNKFFRTLNDLNLDFRTRVFPDHHRFDIQDIKTGIDETLLMTEKDAVKCENLVSENAYYLNVEMQLPETFLESLFQAVKTLQNR